MERKIFVCECHSLEHQVSFWYDEEDELVYIETHLTTHDNFFKRLWVGLKYAFGYKSRFGEWDEVLMGEDKQKELYEWFESKYNTK
jgi:hypothetical protein